MLRSLLLLLILLAGAAGAAVPPGINGSWYDAAHPGHGLSIQVQDDGRAIAYWFVYDPDGNPVHLYIDGAIDDRTIRGTVYRPQGMRFGTFDPATLSVARWGVVSISFSDCNKALLWYHADEPSFGTGTIALTRLSQLATQRCEGRELDPIPAGIYAGRYRQTTYFGSSTDEYGIVGLVDHDGKLWAHDANRRIPGPAYFPSTAPAVVATPTSPRVDGDRVVLDAQAAYAHALHRPDERRLGRGIDPLTVTYVNSALTATAAPLTAVEALALELHADATAAIQGRLDAASLADTRFFTELQGYLGVPTSQLWIRDAAGNLCLRINTPECRFEGRMRIRSTTLRVFDFELTEVASGARYTGRGWLERGNPERIHLVGTSDRNGLYYTAVLQ